MFPFNVLRAELAIPHSWAIATTPVSTLIVAPTGREYRRRGWKVDNVPTLGDNCVYALTLNWVGVYQEAISLLEPTKEVISFSSKSTLPLEISQRREYPIKILAHNIAVVR
jgi:hypothetical protein